MIDVLGILGCALIVSGVALVHVPSALIVSGVMILIGVARHSQGRK